MPSRFLALLALYAAAACGALAQSDQFNSDADPAMYAADSPVRYAEIRIKMSIRWIRVLLF